MAELPRGTVTFVFTDLEGSTRLLQQFGRDGYSRILADHHRLLRAAFAEHEGAEVDTQGDALFVAFRTARDAVDAAVAAQRALAAHDWPEGAHVRVRMGLHTGEALVDHDRYVGVAVHRAQRVSVSAHGGQVLLSNATREMVEDELPRGVALRDLGEQRLKDLDRPARLYQLDIDGLASDFPPVRAEAAAPFEATPAPTGLRRVVATREGRTAVAAGALLVLAGVVAAFALARHNDSADVLAGADALAVIDPSSNDVSERLDVGATPAAVAAGEGAVWVVNADAQTIAHVDPDTDEVSPFGTGGTPVDLAAGEGGVWVTNGAPLSSAQTVGPVATSLVRVNPVTRGLEERIALPLSGGGITNATDHRTAWCG